MTEELTEEEKQAENERLAKLEAKQTKNRRRGRKPKPVVKGKRGIDGDDLIDVICNRRIGLGGADISDIGEEIYMPKSVAKTLQDSGAIKVSL